jgi:hypothetical protein
MRGVVPFSISPKAGCAGFSSSRPLGQRRPYPGPPHASEVIGQAGEEVDEGPMMLRAEPGALTIVA